MARRRQAEAQLKQQTEREQLVNQITQDIRQSLQLDQVLATTVKEVQQLLQADRVLIYRLYDDGTGCAIHETVLAPYPAVLGQTFPEEVFPQAYHQAYADGKTRAISHVQQQDVEPCLREFVAQFGVQAKLIVPIIQDVRNVNSPHQTTGDQYLWGLLIAHQCRQPRTWETWEVELLSQLSTQVAIAVQQSELYTQLQQLNSQLEQRVQQRTVELADANTALLHTNETLQALVKASPRAIIMLDRQGQVKIWNPAAERIFGWTEAEVIDQPNPIGLHDQRSDYPAIQSQVLQGKTYSRLEMRQQRKDGNRIDMVFSAAPLKDKQNAISGIVAIIADITEQKQQAEELRLLQSVVVNTNDAVIITEVDPIDDPGPRIIYVNEAFTRITGYTPAEILGKTPRILQGPKTDPSELAKIRQALKSWEAVTVEVINYRKDGTEFWNEFSIVPVSDATGLYTHWIAVQRDTTGRKQVDQALRQSEERFRSLIENALDIIMILNLDGTFAYVSPSVEKILGYAATELITQTVSHYVTPDDWEQINHRLINPSDATDSTHPIEFRYRHRDGSWRILEAVSQPFVAHKTPLGHAPTVQVMVNARDITERKRLDEIRLALEREKELNTLKTRFFSMASHEFRTPLSISLAAAQLLENSQEAWENNEKRLRNLHRIQDSVKNMVQLLDDILTINRAETGNLAFNPKPLDLERYCQHFVEEMQFNIESQHDLRFDCQGEHRPIALDEKLLRSILSNLISNSVKYSPQGGPVKLTLSYQPDQVQIQVEDHGIGIPEASKPQLFEPFHRGNNIKSIPGTGLGLVVVKKCVDLHQGSIEIISQVDQGTTCRITLPH
ncbi:PAS domain S-box protein [filamentous cyanobacterium LEGE 11480]|uniref:histidine kinase n=2 Tax=Romeriopsis TaxID=2992131 RepID=A0A928VP45_9CYAN|nr:PAS domain S-box protein [Romeriopsis navalis LEGE 11480]